MSFRKKILNPFFFILNILAALGFLMALFAPFVSPQSMSIFAYAATGFPVILIVNILFLIWWLVQLNRKIVLPIITLLIGFFALGRTYGFGEAYQEIRDEDKLSVMTYNVRSFNRYAWLDLPNIPQKVASLIMQEAPDIIFFQEYHHNQSFELPGYPYQIFGDQNSGLATGLAIYSKFPLKGIENLKLDENNKTINLLRTKLIWKDKEITLYNVHLASVGLEKPDYETLQNIDYEEGKKMKSGLRKIVVRLHRAYRRRAGQAEKLATYLKEDTGLMILGGDFNDVPQSYLYKLVNDHLTDSFINGGASGFGKSFTRGPIPLRIDYLWHHEALRAVNYHVVQEEYSDHYPMMVDFVYKP